MQSDFQLSNKCSAEIFALVFTSRSTVEVLRAGVAGFFIPLGHSIVGRTPILVRCRSNSRAVILSKTPPLVTSLMRLTA